MTTEFVISRVFQVEVSIIKGRGGRHIFPCERFFRFICRITSAAIHRNGQIQVRPRFIRPIMKGFGQLVTTWHRRDTRPKDLIIPIFSIFMRITRHGVIIHSPFARTTNRQGIAIYHSPTMAKARRVALRVNGISVTSMRRINGVSFIYRDFNSEKRYLTFYQVLRSKDNQLYRVSIRRQGSSSIYPRQVNVRIYRGCSFPARSIRIEHSSKVSTSHSSHIYQRAFRRSGRCVQS